MLGVEFPICAFSHCRDVVAAVTNAGGFGVLGAVAHSPERLRNELTWIDEQTGGKPYGVDLLLPPKYVGAEEGGIDAKQARSLLPEEHRAFVDDLLVRYGIAAPTEPPRDAPAGGLNISPKGYEPLAGSCLRAQHSADRQRARVPAGGPRRASPRPRRAGGRTGRQNANTRGGTRPRVSI